MTLSEFALVVDGPSKWVLNALALLSYPLDYTVEAAERIALIRLLNRDLGVGLSKARDIAEKALRATDKQEEPAGIVHVAIDIPRLRAAIATRLSQVATHHAPRRAGRRPRRTAPITAAKRYGFDVTLLQENLKRSPTERLRQLDGMMAFSAAVRRRK